MSKPGGSKKKDVVSLSNIAVTPSLTPPKPWDEGDNSTEQAKERLEAARDMASVMGDVVCRDVRTKPLKPIKQNKMGFPVAQHRKLKHYSDVDNKSTTDPAHTTNTPTAVAPPTQHTFPPTTYGIEKLTNKLLQQECADEIKESTKEYTTEQKTEALMMALRSQVLSQRLYAAEALLHVIGEERRNRVLDGVLYHLLLSNQCVQFVTMLRCSIDDTNHNAFTHALRVLYTILYAENEFRWMTVSFESNCPPKGVLSLHWLTDLLITEDEISTSTLEQPRSEDDMKVLVASNVAIALLTVNILHRFRYTLEDVVFNTPKNDHYTLSIIKYLCVHTHLTAPTILNVPGLVKLLLRKLVDNIDTTEGLTVNNNCTIIEIFRLMCMHSENTCRELIQQCDIITVSLRVLLTLVAENNLIVLLKDMKTQKQESTHYEFPLKAFGLVKEVLLLWVVFSRYPLCKASPLLVDVWSIVSQLLQLPFIVLEETQQRDGQERYTVQQETSFSSLITHAFDITKAVYQFIATFVYSNNTADATTSSLPDLDAFVCKDSRMVLEKCANVHALYNKRKAREEDTSHTEDPSVIKCLCQSLLSSVINTIVTILFELQQQHEIHVLDDSPYVSRTEVMVKCVCDVLFNSSPNQQFLPIIQSCYDNPYPLMTEWNDTAMVIPHTLECLPNLIWLPQLTPHLYTCCIQSQLLSACLTFYNLVHNMPHVSNIVNKQSMNQKVHSLMSSFNNIKHCLLLDEPQDSKEKVWPRWIQLTLNNELHSVYTCLRIMHNDGTLCDKDQLLVTGCNMTLYLTPTDSPIFYFLTNNILQPSEYKAEESNENIISAYLSNLALLYDTNQTTVLEHSCYYTYESVVHNSTTDSNCEVTKLPLQLVSTWIHQMPIQDSKKNPIQVEDNYMQNFVIRYLDFLHCLEVPPGHPKSGEPRTYISQLDPRIKLCYLCSVFLTDQTDFFLTETFKHNLSRLARVYSEQLDAYTPQSNHKVIKLYPFFEKMIKVYMAGCYGDPVISQFVILFFHWAFPSQFRLLLLDTVSETRQVFNHIGRAMTANLGSDGLKLLARSYIVGCDEHVICHNRESMGIQQYCKLIELYTDTIIVGSTWSNAKSADELHQNIIFPICIIVLATEIWAKGNKILLSQLLKNLSRIELVVALARCDIAFHRNCSRDVLLPNIIDSLFLAEIPQERKTTITEIAGKLKIDTTQLVF